MDTKVKELYEQAIVLAGKENNSITDLDVAEKFAQLIRDDERKRIHKELHTMQWMSAVDGDPWDRAIETVREWLEKQ